MTKYKRITGKVFGGNATATGDDPQIAQFGSALAGTFIGTTDVETIQQLPAWGQGWIGAVTPDTQYPALPEMTGVMKVLSHQICAILQEGIPSWDNGTIYYSDNWVSKNGNLYKSLIDENQGNDPETDTTNWQEFASGEWGKIEGNIANQTDLQEQLANKADKSEIDGAWIKAGENYVVVSSAKAAGTYTIDLSPYLTEDSEYEALITCQMRSNKVTEVGVSSSLTPYFSTIVSNQYMINSRNAFIIPIGKDKKLIERITEGPASSVCNICLLAYRKLGKKN